MSHKLLIFMKHNRLFLLMALFPILGTLQAQTSYEAAALLDSDLSGTARYVGMGGAMSALGADMSTMGTNPAGTALYRSWDAAFSFGGNWVTQHTNSASNHGRAFSSYGSFDNAGLVVASKQSNNGVLRFVNFGFNYRNVKRFGGKMGMASNLGGLSQTGQMAWQAYENMDVRVEDFDAADPDGFFQKNYYGDSWVGWLTLMGAQGYLIDASSLNQGAYYPAFGNSYSEKLSGGIDAYDFNLSFNFSDAIYFGVTFTTYDVDRHLVSSYSEEFEDGSSYTLDNYYRTVGSGYDFKFGAIVRPFGSSFRFGVSVTTPTVYSLYDYNSAVLNSNVWLTDGDGNTWLQGTKVDTYDAVGGDCLTSYTMTAPSKFNVSLGGTLGTSWALGAEYEYTNYGNIKLYDDRGMENTVMNTHTNSNFAGRHTLRLGAEKTFGTFYTRAGYNYQTGGYKNTSWKMIPINSVQTNTAYTNIEQTHNITCGVGFRGDVFYADAALLYSIQHAAFYPFDDLNLPATSLQRNLAKGVMTIGVRF